MYLIQDGQVRVSRGASRETVAVMNRLEVLGEALLLNAEGINQWTYVASSEHVTSGKLITPPLGSHHTNTWATSAADVCLSA